MTAVLLLAVFFMAPFYAGASRVSDSLKQQLDGQTNDSLKVALLNELSYEYLEQDASLALYYAQKAITIASKNNAPFGLMRSWGQMGSAFRKLNNYNRAIECYIKGEKYAEQLNDPGRRSAFDYNIGILYQELHQYKNAEKFLSRSIDADTKTGDLFSQAMTLNALGALYIETGALQKARISLLRSCNRFRESGNSPQAGMAYRNLGITENKLGHTAAAIRCFEKAFDLYVNLAQNKKAAECLRLLAGIYYQLNNAGKAIFYYEKSLAYADQLTAAEIGGSHVMYFVAESYLQKGELQKAYSLMKKGYLAYEDYFARLDSIKALERDRAFAEMATRYNIEKAEKENHINKLVIENEKASNSRKRIIIWFFVVGVALLAGLLFMVVRSNRFIKKTSQAIRQQKEQIEAQRDEISYKNREITSSIEYAKSLQDAILPDDSVIRPCLPVHFILWLPRDIVSGDFYWFYENEHTIFLAAADCTGHGVPGAFVSMTCHNILNQVVIDQKEEDPGTILSRANIAVSGVFKREGSLTQANDGMDITLVAIDKKSRTLRFSGAMNPLVRIHDKKAIVYKADRYAIGGRTPADYHFQTTEVLYEKGDWFYMFSDGFKDQFGGEEGKKYMNARFIQFLADNSHLPASVQMQALKEELANWMGAYERTDDVLITGFQL